MAITASGLISGIDTDSLISGILAVERRPITLLQQKEAGYQAQISAYGSVKSVLSGLQSSISALTESDDFDPGYSATSGNTDLLTVEAGDDASAGTYSIKVNQLATTAQMTGNTYTTSTDTVGTGTLQFKLGDGNRISVDIDSSSDDLDEIASAINDSSAEVSASVLKVSDTDYRLTITGNDTGEDITYNYQEEGLTFSTTTQASSSTGEIQTSETYDSDSTALGLTGTLTVDGNDIALTGTETLNDIQSSVDGLSGISATVNYDASSGKYTLAIENDTADSGVDITFGDATAASGLSNLIDSGATVAAEKALVNINGIDVERESNTIDDLITGVTVNLVDEDNTETFSVTVNENHDSVVSKVSSFVDSYNSAIDTLSGLQTFGGSDGQSGMLLGDATAMILQSGLRRVMFTSVDGVASSVNNMSSLGVSFDSSGKLTFNSSDLETALEDNTTDVVNFFTQNTSNKEEGFAHTMENFLDGYLNSGGVLDTKESGLNTSIDKIQDQVENLETRITQQETLLRNQFANLEQILAGFQSTQSFLTQQLSMLSGS